MVEGVEVEEGEMIDIQKVVTESCRHQCPECGEDFACGHRPQDCRDSRFAICDDCLERNYRRRVEEEAYVEVKD